MADDSIRGYFEEIIETGEGFKANCPMCEDTKKAFNWNEDKSVGCCFHESCDWYKDKGGVTDWTLRKFFGDKPSGTPRVVHLEVSENADAKLPDEFRVIADLHPSLRDTITTYLTETRGLSRRIIEMADVGYCERGQFWGYIVFPVYDNGEVVWWQGRRFKNRDPKFYNPHSHRKTEFLYDYGGGSNEYRHLVLVESIINALTIGPRHTYGSTKVQALLGKSLSGAQLKKILKHKDTIKDIVLALDPDAISETVANADLLSKHFENVRVANFPYETDVNKLGRVTSWQIIDEAERYRRKERLSFQRRRYEEQRRGHESAAH